MNNKAITDMLKGAILFIVVVAVITLFYQSLYAKSVFLKNDLVEETYEKYYSNKSSYQQLSDKNIHPNVPQELHDHAKQLVTFLFSQSSFDELYKQGYFKFFASELENDNWHLVLINNNDGVYAYLEGTKGEDKGVQSFVAGPDGAGKDSANSFMRGKRLCVLPQDDDGLAIQSMIHSYNKQIPIASSPPNFDINDYLVDVIHLAYGSVPFKISFLFVANNSISFAAKGESVQAPFSPGSLVKGETKGNVFFRVGDTVCFLPAFPTESVAFRSGVRYKHDAVQDEGYIDNDFLYLLDTRASSFSKEEVHQGEYVKQ